MLSVLGERILGDYCQYLHDIYRDWKGLTQRPSKTEGQRQDSKTPTANTQVVPKAPGARGVEVPENS